MTLGYPDGTFRPQQPLSRWHAVVFMERYYDEILGADESEDFTRGDMMVLLKAINDGTLRGTDAPDGPASTAPGAAEGQRFPDVPADHYAFGAVEWAASVGVTLGFADGTFRPQQPLSRWHAVVFMERYYDEILGADESEDFTRGDMMVLLKAINDGTLRDTDTGTDTGTDADAGPLNPVAAGEFHSCAVRSDGTVACWGDSQFGQADAPSGTFKAVAAGGSHSCAIRDDGTVACWGSNQFGQADAPSGTFKAVAAGGVHSCAIRIDDSAACWDKTSRARRILPRVPSRPWLPAGFTVAASALTTSMTPMAPTSPTTSMTPTAPTAPMTPMTPTAPLPAGEAASSPRGGDSRSLGCLQDLGRRRVSRLRHPH